MTVSPVVCDESGATHGETYMNNATNHGAGKKIGHGGNPSCLLWPKLICDSSRDLALEVLILISEIDGNPPAPGVNTLTGRPA